MFGFGHETVHLAAVQIDRERRVVMRMVSVAVLVVGERLVAPAVNWIWQADAGWEAISAGESAEERIERPVLHHDHDDVLDLVDTEFGARRRSEPAAGGRASRGLLRLNADRASHGHGSCYRGDPRQHLATFHSAYPDDPEHGVPRSIVTVCRAMSESGAADREG